MNVPSFVVEVCLIWFARQGFSGALSYQAKSPDLITGVAHHDYESLQIYAPSPEAVDFHIERVTLRSGDVVHLPPSKSNSVLIVVSCSGDGVTGAVSGSQPIGLQTGSTFLVRQATTVTLSCSAVSATIYRCAVRVEDNTFTCPECDYSTKRRYDLQRHLKVHADDRQFACDVADCNARFVLKADLHKHIRLKHQPSSDEFMCPECDKTFSRLDTLRRTQKECITKRASDAPKMTAITTQPGLQI